jgi:hypothetical protein
MLRSIVLEEFSALQYAYDIEQHGVEFYRDMRFLRCLHANVLTSSPDQTSPQQIHIAGTRPGQAGQLRTARNAVIPTACVIPSESVKEIEALYCEA